MGKSKNTNQSKNIKQQQNTNISNQSQSKIENKSSFTIVWFINFILANVVTYYLLNKVCNQEYTSIFVFHTSTTTQAIEIFGLFLSILLLAYTFSADWLEIAVDKTQNDLYRSHKNIISNTIQWSVIFLGILVAYHRKDGQTQLAVALVDLFLLGRVVFSIGYTFGALIKQQSFRAVGFGMSIGPVIVLLGEVTGYSIIKYLQ